MKDNKLFFKCWYLAVFLATGNSLVAQNTGISMGQSTATGNHSFAAGDTSLAAGEASVAIGYKAQALGDYSFAVGNNTTAGGLGSFAAGVNTFIPESAPGAIAFGSASSANAPNSVAMGINNITRPTAIGAAAFGAGNVAIGDASFVAGQENTAYSFGEVALGQYSEGYTGGTPHFSRVPTDRILTIGNGIDKNNRSNALVMYKSGNTELFGNLTVSKQLQIGSDNQSQSPTDGVIRYNSQIEDFEGYTKGEWHSLTSASTKAFAPAWEVGDWEGSFGSEFAGYLTTSPNNILGESTHSEHIDAIEIVSIEQNEDRDVRSFGTREDYQIDSFGTATLLKHRVDRSSPQFWELVNNGDHLEEMNLTIRNVLSDNILSTYTFKNIKVVEMDVHSDAQTIYKDRLKIQFGCIEINHYKPGGLEEELIGTFYWNYKEHSNNTGLPCNFLF